MISRPVSREQQEASHRAPSDDSIQPEDETTPQEGSTADIFEVDLTTEASVLELVCDAPENEAQSPADATGRVNHDTMTVSTGAYVPMLGPAFSQSPAKEQSPNATTASTSPAPIDYIMGEPSSRPEEETTWVVLQQVAPLEDAVGGSSQEAGVSALLDNDTGFDDDMCPALRDHTYGRRGWTYGRRKRRLTRSERDALRKRSKRRCFSSTDADDSGWEGDDELSEESEDELETSPEFPVCFSPPRVLIKSVVIVAAKII
ncbi:hypothetical protein V5799_004763 [Amblyomma americanum]|uniref:Uncharacterized protein n=1 Tax=Amblyomma americanum TaxID=6943 RepID=A0AAQ4D566_AMBAM